MRSPNQNSRSVRTKADASQNAICSGGKFDVTNRVIGLLLVQLICKNFVNSPASFGGGQKKGFRVSARLVKVENVASSLDLDVLHLSVVDGSGLR
jgi:hypothetical protein